MKLCQCGRRIYGLGARCHTCQGRHRAKQAASRPKHATRRAQQDAKRCPEHLAWIRTLPCAVRDCHTGEHIEAHHVRLGTNGGTALKPADWWAVPLCFSHHDEINGGARTFEKNHGVDLRRLAETLAARSPYLVRPAASD